MGARLAVGLVGLVVVVHFAPTRLTRAPPVEQRRGDGREDRGAGGEDHGAGQQRGIDAGLGPRRRRARARRATATAAAPDVSHSARRDAPKPGAGRPEGQRRSATSSAATPRGGPGGGHQHAADDVGRMVRADDEDRVCDRQHAERAGAGRPAPHSGGATSTAQRASDVAAVRWPLGQLAGSSHCGDRGVAVTILSTCVVTFAHPQIATTATALRRSPSASAATVSASTASAYGPQVEEAR